MSCWRGLGPLSRAGPRDRCAVLPFERVREDQEAVREAVSEDARDVDDFEEAEDGSADALALLLAADLEEATLAVSVCALDDRPSLPRAAAFFVTLLAAARSTISQMEDSFMSVTHG